MAALLAGSGAVSLYVWGMLHLLGAVMQAEDGGAGSSPLGPCREAGDQIASQVVGYDVGYGWLRFTCRLSDGGTYTTSAVPGYVNPAATLLGVTAFVLAAVRYGTTMVAFRMAVGERDVAPTGVERAGVESAGGRYSGGGFALLSRRGESGPAGLGQRR